MKFFLFIFTACFSLSIIQADEPVWGSFQTLESGFETIKYPLSYDIAQNKNYVLVAWVSTAGSVIKYAYSNDKGITWNNDSLSTDVYVAVKTGFADNLPVISYVTNNTDLLCYVNCFSIEESSGTWTIGSSPISLGEGSSKYFSMDCKNNVAIIASKKSLFYNTNINDDFLSWKVESTEFQDLDLYQVSISNEYAFLAGATRSSDNTIKLYKISLSSLSSSLNYSEYTGIAQSAVSNNLFSFLLKTNDKDEFFLTYYMTGFSTIGYASTTNDETLVSNSYDISSLNASVYLIKDLSFTDNNIAISFFTTNAAMTSYDNYILTTTYDNPENITINSPTDLNISNNSFFGSCQFVENYLVYSWIEWEGASVFYFNSAVKNIAEDSSWEKIDQTSLPSFSGSVGRLCNTKLAKYLGNSNGVVQIIWEWPASTTEIITTYVSLPIETYLNLSYTKYKNSFLLQDIFSNKISWDKLEDAEYYNVYKDASLSERIYKGTNTYFVDSADRKESKTYYVTWVNLEGIEQKAKEISVPKE